MSGATIATTGKAMGQIPDPTVPKAVPAVPPALPAYQGDENRAIAGAQVTVSLDNVTLDQALRAIQDSAGVTIAFGNRVVPLQKRVSLSVTNMPVLTALRAVLVGTGVNIRVSPNGKIVLYDGTQTSGAADSVGMLQVYVYDLDSKAPLSQVQISLRGTQHRTLTSSQGIAQLPGVSVGRHFVVARLLGYGEVQVVVTVGSGYVTTTSVSMVSLPTKLQEVVTTGAGEQRRVTVGNDVTTLDVPEIVRTMPVSTVSDLLKTRVPGMQVLSSGGTAGAPSRIRIRGVSSVISNSDPIVILDGIRIAGPSSATQRELGGQSADEGNQATGGSYVPATSRLDDIDINMIESIDVLKGPAASTLYGSDAANGVIVIKTKRGTTGQTRWSVSGTSGWKSMKASFVEPWRAWGTDALEAGRVRDCALAAVAIGDCTQDSITRYNPLNYRNSTPWGTGRANRLSANVSGGRDAIQYSFGSSYTHELGMLVMPESEAAMLLERRNGTPIPEWAKRPNMLRNGSVTANVSMQLDPRVDLAVTGIFSDQYHRDARQGANSFISAAYTGPGFIDSLGRSWNDNDSPGWVFLTRSSDQVRRISGSVQSTIRPTRTINVRMNTGIDQASRKDETLRRPIDAFDSVGDRSANHANTSVVSADMHVTHSVPLQTWLQLRSSVGVQYVRETRDAVRIGLRGLPAGEDYIPSRSDLNGGETFSQSATAGWFLNEELALRDRLFFTMALRGDAGSSFGRDARTILYPKFNTSWLVSEEPFFPHMPALTNLRLRFAFGQAGQQPSVSARFRSYSTRNIVWNGQSIPVILVSTIGNTHLQPERSSEVEGGFDLGLFDDRVTVDATMYRKYTKNNLIQVTLPPSMGMESRQENLGEVDNRGIELSASANPITSKYLNWNVTLGWSQNENKLVRLANASFDNDNLMSSQTRYVAGYPLGGYWAKAMVGYHDVNGDGIITRDEIQYTDSAVYLGSPLPKSQMSINNSVGLWGGRVSVATTFSYTGGQTIYNSVLASRCSAERCPGIIDPSTPLSEQAIARSLQAGENYAAFERASWLRWDNISVSFMIPDAMLSKLRSRNASVVLMGSNLHIWTKYTGADPEVNTIPHGNYARDSGGIPQTRDWTIRFNLSF